MWKDDLDAHVFQHKNWCSPKSDRWLLFLLWLSENPSIGTISIEKKYGGTGLFPEKTETLHAELNEWEETATSTATVDFLQYIYSLLVAKNH